MNHSIPKANLANTLPVLKYGNPILREKVQILEDFTNLPNMVAQMIETMDAERGIGLAANQVGWNVNLMVIDTRHYNEDEDGEYHIIANAEILSSEGEFIMEEGCLSIPDIRAEIKRPETILLKYQDMKQNIHEKYFSGLVSRAIQHEFDHLNGKLFIDYLSQTKRMLINKRLLEISKTGRPSSSIIL